MMIFKKKLKKGSPTVAFGSAGVETRVWNVDGRILFLVGLVFGYRFQVLRIEKENIQLLIWVSLEDISF